MNNTTPFPPVKNGPGDIVAEAAALAPWFQNLHLPDGTQTAPELPSGDMPNTRWAQIRDFLPDDLSGCTALDVGCNAGFYAIELARRGAMVTAVDHDPHVLRQAQWAIAQYGLQDRIKLFQGAVYDLARWNQRHDVVLFLGMFERLRYPVLALDLAARLVKRCFVFQARSMPGVTVEGTSDDPPASPWEALARPGWPKLAFIEKPLAGESRSWWVPDRACTEAMLRSTGLEIVERPGDDVYLCQPDAPRAVDAGRSENELGSATGVAPGGLTQFRENPRAAPTTANHEVAATGQVEFAA